MTIIVTPQKRPHLRRAARDVRPLRPSPTGVIPAAPLPRAIGWIQYHDSLQRLVPLRVGSSRRVAALARLLPNFDRRERLPFRRPRALDLAIGQAYLAWRGRGGEYLGGSAFSARKPDARPAG
jgi:hypothetical protein